MFTCISAGLRIGVTEGGMVAMFPCISAGLLVLCDRRWHGGNVYLHQCWTAVWFDRRWHGGNSHSFNQHFKVATAS